MAIDAWTNDHRVLRLTTLSLAHPDVPVAERARLARLIIGSRSTFVLTTCLRVEVAWVGQADQAFLPKDLQGRGRERLDQEAFAHLCRVAAGLESPVTGEPEVLGQFRRALSGYRESSSASPALLKVLESAIGVARSGRRLLPVPLRGSLAVQAAKEAAAFDQVAVLGTGAMARATVDALPRCELALFGRRPASIQNHSTRSWSEALNALSTFPAVISTVPGKTPLFPQQAVSEAFAARSDPLLLIDLGMPPGFDPPSHRVVRYLGIDDLASSIRTPVSGEADEQLRLEAQKSWRRLNFSGRAGEVISSLNARAEDAVREEVRRFVHRLRATDDPEQVLAQLARTVARRVLHPPISYLGASDPETVEVLASAFGIDDD